MRLRLRIRLFRDPPPSEDDALGRFLEDKVRGALSRGGAPPMGVVVRPERMELVELAALRQAKIPMPAFFAGLTRSEVEDHAMPVAVGLIGRLMARRRGDDGPPAPTVHVFLEWPDNRWWHWKALLDADGQIIDDTPTLRRAVDGDALPNGLGRWWSRGRRTGARVRMGKLSSTPVQAPPQVH